MSKTALITGCSSGVGLASVVAMAKDGYRVWATMRNTAKAGDLNAAVDAANVKDKVVVQALDVCDDASVTAAVTKMIADEGRIDVLVNNAGFTKFGGVEMMTMDAIKEQFDTNFYGCVRTMQAVLPQMRKQRSGHLIHISSVGGIWGQPLNDTYCASKFALEGFVESMASTYQQFNIQSSLIEPGGIKTAFIANAHRPDMSGVPAELAPHVMQIANIYQENAKTGNSQTADEIAAFVLSTANNPNPPLRVQTNPAIQGIFQLQLADPSGNAGVAAASGKFYPPGWLEAMSAKKE